MSHRSVIAAVLAALALAACATGPAPSGKRALMIVGNDEKQNWNDAGAAMFAAAGRDTVTVVDIGTDPLAPRTLVSLPLTNTIVGPPVNLAITPDEGLALVANSINVAEEAGVLKQVPDNRLWVIDLTANPPKLIDTVVVGKQPSGLSINRAGTLALIANRADGSVSVMRISGKKVELIDTVVIGEQVSHVVFTPDGKRALAAKFNAHKVALLDVSGDKVTYGKLDLPAGLWPYNVAVAPGGKIALTADNGGAGSSDGSVDTVSVVDLEASPPRIIDRVVVGDGPEGLAISPKGDVAVAIILAGSNNPSAYFYKPHGSVSVLAIDGKKVTKVGDVEVGGLPEGAAFTPDGKYLLVGNYLDQDISILKVDGSKITDTGKRFKLPGHPASVRIGDR
jgi:DNA-binding beta-propeller fold protein YncE